MNFSDKQRFDFAVSYLKDMTEITREQAAKILHVLKEKCQTKDSEPN